MASNAATLPQVKSQEGRRQCHLHFSKKQGILLTLPLSDTLHDAIWTISKQWRKYICKNILSHTHTHTQPFNGLLSGTICWSFLNRSRYHSFSSFISFSMYSFHVYLIPLSSTITFPEAPFLQFNPVISCLYLTMLCHSKKFILTLRVI